MSPLQTLIATLDKHGIEPLTLTYQHYRTDSNRLRWSIHVHSCREFRALCREWHGSLLDEVRAGRWDARDAVILAHAPDLLRRAESVEAERDALAAKVAAVRDLHQPIDALNTTARPGQQLVKVCSGCGTDDGNWQRWPCPTIRALDEKPRIATAATETGQGTPSSPSGHPDSPPDANGAQKGAPGEAH